MIATRIPTAVTARRASMRRRHHAAPTHLPHGRRAVPTATLAIA